MNVYDFDKTIYNKDSTFQFYFFCLKKNLFLLRFAFIQIWYLLIYIFGLIDKTKFKSGFFSFLKGIVNIDGYLFEFWQKNQRYINGWYIKQKKDTDVIISASPEFLLLPICRILGVKNLIASKVDEKTGKFYSKNCYGEEKLLRLKNDLNINKIDRFYSDSLSDSPLASISKEAYLVDNKNFISWKDYKPTKIGKVKKLFFSKQFIGFLIIGAINAINGVLFAAFFTIFLDGNSAFVCGYIISLTVSYVLNSFLVFKNKIDIKKYFKFCISYIPNFLIQNLIVFLLYNLLELNKYFTYSVAVILSIPITFLALKLFAFKNK